MIPDYKRNIVENLSVKIILPHKRMLCLSCQVGMPVWSCQKMWPRICRFKKKTWFKPWKDLTFRIFKVTFFSSCKSAMSPFMKLLSYWGDRTILFNFLIIQIIEIKNWPRLGFSPEYILGVVIGFNIVISEADGDSIKVTPENRYVWDWHVYIRFARHQHQQQQ